MAKKNRLFTRIILGIAVAIGGWAAFNLIRLLLSDVLVKIGIMSEIWQAAALLGLVVVVLLGFGIGFKDSLLKLFSK